jgi:hypothetical protein
MVDQGAAASKLELKVASIDYIAVGIRSFTLVDSNGRALPPFTAARISPCRHRPAWRANIHCVTPPATTANT